MMRAAVLAVADSDSVRRAVTGGAGRRVALRFVAGERLSDALRVCGDLNGRGAEVSLDHLGENVSDPDHARAAAGAYLEALDRIRERSRRAEVSVKLTQLGLDIDPALALENARAVVERAAAVGTTVTLDMEDHRYTDRTIESCLKLNEQFPGRVGIAIQAALRRTPEDLERLIDAEVRVRLCKGAYKEPRAIALQGRGEVCRAFTRLATRLFASRAYPMIATHDDRLIRHALGEAERVRRAPDGWELQMLYGVRRELQRRLVSRGRRLRVYVPYGDQWYPYLTRRIAERPANVRFFLEALARG